jgi:hypothetical protein
MGVMERLSSMIDRLATQAVADELPPRAERRLAARLRPHRGHRFWTARDRHLDPGAAMDIAHASDTWPLAKGILSVAKLRRGRDRSK